MGDLVIVSKLADLENVPYYGELKLSSGTISPIEEKNSCVLTGYDITIQAHDYPAIRCYNSAVYKSTNEQEFYIFCPLSEPNYLMIWKTGSIFSYSRYNNVQYENVYLDTLNYGPITADGATFPYFNYSLDYRNVGGENNVKWIDSLPVFDNLQNFVDYVTAPLEPRGEATCKVTYFLPDDTYEYTKLTYKKDIQPESVNDGTIVNLDSTQDSVTVEGLIENASYWFKIFTSKSESEAFGYTVGEMGRPFYILPKLSAKFKIFCSSGTDVELSVQEIYDKLTTSGHIAPEEAKTFILYQTTSARGYVIGLFPVYTSSLKLYTKEGLSQEYTDDYITGIDYDSATSYSLRFYLNTDLTLHSIGYGSTYLTSYKTINDKWISAWGTSITGAIMPIVYCNMNPSEYSSIYLNDKQISVNVN